MYTYIKNCQHLYTSVSSATNAILFLCRYSPKRVSNTHTKTYTYKHLPHIQLLPIFKYTNRRYPYTHHTGVLIRRAPAYQTRAALCAHTHAKPTHPPIRTQNLQMHKTYSYMHTKTHMFKTYTNTETHTHRTYTRTKDTRPTHTPHSDKTNTHIIHAQNTNTHTKETHIKTHLQRTHPLPTASLCSHAQKRPTHTPTNTTHTHTCGEPIPCLCVFKHTNETNTRTKETYTYIHLLRI